MNSYSIRINADDSGILLQTLLKMDLSRAFPFYFKNTQTHASCVIVLDEEQCTVLALSVPNIKIEKINEEKLPY